MFHMGRVATRLRRKGGDITAEQLRSIWHRQQGLCALTGTPMKISPGGQDLHSMSVDRIKPKLGYIVSNIRLTTWQANAARLIGDDEDLIQFCQGVLTYYGFTITGP